MRVQQPTALFNLAVRRHMPDMVTAIAIMTLLAGMASIAWSAVDKTGAVPGMGQTWVEIDGQVYGAKPDERGPIGGGEGYTCIITDGDFRVRTVDELRDALAKATPGQVVFVEPDADMDCTTLAYAEKLVLEVPEGVTLAGDRGHNRSPGAMIYSDTFATQPLIRVLGPNVRITGLCIRGPDPKERADHWLRSFADSEGKLGLGHKYYYKFPTSEGITTEYPSLEVDNCELSGWSHSAIFLLRGKDQRIHHNYIHHVRFKGLGYAVCVGSGTALITHNVFDYNLHSIAGTGGPSDGYEACNNVDLQHIASNSYDMHAGHRRSGGLAVAGDWVKIHHNTFGSAHVPAVIIGGAPAKSATVERNWFHHEAPGQSVVSPWPPGGETHLECRDNAYGPTAPKVE
jgi:hypothetical protein